MPKKNLTLAHLFILGGFLISFGYYLGVKGNFQKLFASNLLNTQSQVVDDEAPYIESGSPLDNRAINPRVNSSAVISHGPRDKKQIALTFDAEMTNSMKQDVLSGKNKSYEKRITDTLIKTNTKATLFLTGQWIELYPNETEELSKNPLFEFGSHSYSDSSYQGYCYGLKKLPDALKIEDIGATEKLLREYVGIDNRLFRFPGGCYSQHDLDLVKAANDSVVHWDVKGNDGFNNDTNLIVRNVVDNVQNGSIIILHMNGAPTAPKTADALPIIISTLKARSYEFVKVNELLGLPAEPRATSIERVLSIQKVINFFKHN